MVDKAGNDARRWREFDKNKVTHSAAHYLMAIDTLRNEYGYARVTDVAERLDVSRGAASLALSQLKKRDLVKEDRNRFVMLTEKGRGMAHDVEANFAVLSRLFEDVLGVSHEIAQADACKMEHLLSSETGRRLVWLLRYILGDSSRAVEIRKLMGCFRAGCESVPYCPLCEGPREDAAPPEYCPHVDAGGIDANRRKLTSERRT